MPLDTHSYSAGIPGFVGGSWSLKKIGGAILTLDPTTSTANTYPGTVVTTGTLIALNIDALADGSSLTIGANAESIFGTLAPQRNIQQPISMLPITTGNSDSDSGSGSGSTNILWQRVVHGRAALQAIENALDPSNQTHSSSVVSEASDLDVALVENVNCSNGLTAAAVDAVLVREMDSLGMTVTPTTTPSMEESAFPQVINLSHSITISCSSSRPTMSQADRAARGPLAPRLAR